MPTSATNTYTPLPAVRRPAGQARPSSASARQAPRRRAGGDHLLQPDDLHELHAALRPGRRRGLLTRNALGQPYLYRYTASPTFLVGQVDFSRRRAGAFYGACSTRRSDDGYDGWMEDFGEYTPADSRSADGRPAAADAQPLPRRSTTAPRRFRAPRAAAAGALQPLGLDRRGAALADRLGRRPDDVDWGFDGLRSAVDTGADAWACRACRSGARTSAASSRSARADDARAADALDPVRLRLRRHAHPGQRLRAARQPRAQIFDAGPAAGLARYAKLRTQLYPYLARRRARATTAPACRSCATWR